MTIYVFINYWHSLFIKFIIEAEAAPWAKIRVKVEAGAEVKV